MDLKLIVSEINSRAKTHPIGQLQEIRKGLKGLERLPTRRIFAPTTTFDNWAFHFGGRKEIQFNVGFERLNNIEKLRYGVAFSLETSRSLPSIDVLFPKVKLFNDYMQLYSDIFTDMRMWHYKRKKRSSDYTPTSIPPEIVTHHVFIFFGKRQLPAQLDYESLLNDLDRLLPLYRYIESNGNLSPTWTVTTDSFSFRPGCTTKVSSAIATQTRQMLDINLRHNVLQQELYRQLSEKYGAENVGTENASGVGTKIDVVVRQGDEHWFYEIKTQHSPRACLRLALGQLLEYSFWPGSQSATRLIVVGETALDEEGVEYLHALKERFSLPVEYEQIIVT